ncbi:MAG TPA: hypothetical protein VIJ31_09805 [Acidothermaceae bacterium]
MAEVAANVRSYSDGHVYTGLLNSALPTDPTTAVVAPFYEIGWISDKGLSESRTITSTDKFSWQNSTLIRTVRSAEKRTMTFEALEDNAIVQRLIYPAATITSGAGTAAVQTVTINGVPTGGTFTLTFNGATTAVLTAGTSLPTTAAVQSALQALSTIGSGNALVTGSAGGPYTVTFAGTLAAQSVPAITANGALLTGGTNPSVSVAQTTPGVAPITTTTVKPYTGQNRRAWVVDLIDGSITKRITMANAEAVQSGARAYVATDIAVASFTLTCYPDATGTSWIEYCNDPALALTVA